MEHVILKSTDNYELSLKVYIIEKPKGYIQIIHGMQEHQDRYISTINFLNECGYTVISSDVRGHGQNAPILGYFAEDNGYKLVLEDQKIITSYIQKRFNTEKVIILGHSMGTIITRNLLQTESSNYEKVILSGYPHYQWALNLGIVIGKIIKLLKGGKRHSNLLSDLSVGSFHKQIKGARTKLDWLSYNKENVDNYIADPLSGFPFTTSAFIDLFTMMIRMNNVKLYQNINNIPLLLLAGLDDPCVGGEKGMKKSINLLKNVGFNNIKQINYELMRHEILNEKESSKVLNDIKEFLE